MSDTLLQSWMKFYSQIWEARTTPAYAALPITRRPAGSTAARRRAHAARH